MSDPTRMNSVDPAASRLCALAHAAMGTSVAGQSWAWPTIDFSDPEQRHFGDYELLAEIGRGGMGVVYRARQRSLDREVALKFIAAGMADSLQVARFMGEARAAARLVHPNIVPVHEVGSVGDIHYFSMPLIAGESLEARLQRGPMESGPLLDLVIPVCEAVDYAHRLGLLHLDIKPANVLIDARGEPLVADFGLARHVDESGGVAAQEVSGTPAFMAPEQILIQQYRLTAATDLYGLGALLYRALSGVSPHGEGGSEDLIRRALAGRIRPLRELAPQVGADLEAVVARCLELEPKHRYPSVRALMEDLRAVRAGLPVSVRRPGAIERARRWLAREPRLAVAAGVAFVAIAVGGTAAFSQWREAEAARAVAVAERDAAESAREAEAAQRERAQHAAALGARLYARSDEIRHEADAAMELIGWLDQRFPESPELQAAVLADFANALADDDSKLAVQSLLGAVLERLGVGYRRQVIAALESRGDADSLVYAAMLAWREERNEQQPVKVRALLDRALALAPDHEFGWYVASTYCADGGLAECPRPDGPEQLTRLRPDNVWSWLLLAVRREGEASRGALLEAAKREALDDYFTAQYHAMASAIAASGVSVPPLMAGPAQILAPGERPELLVSQLEAFSLPNPLFGRIVTLCRPDQLSPKDEEVRRACLRVGELMAREGGAILTNMLGSVIVRRLVPGTPLAAEMTALRARYLYLVAADEALTPAEQLGYPLARTLEDTREVGELEAYARKLAHYGKPTHPPADWQPADPTALMLPEEREEYRRKEAARAP